MARSSSEIPSSDRRARGADDVDAEGPHRSSSESSDHDRRPWFHPRPDPRGRRDALGFNFIWWLILLAVVVGVLEPWAW